MSAHADTTPCVLYAGKRQLVRNSRDMLIVGAPFLLWGAVVIVIYATSMTQLEKVGHWLAVCSCQCPGECPGA